MSRAEKVILTNMCMIEDNKGNVVMQYRRPERYAWSGFAFPGGHIEKGESLHQAMIREVYEETGLTIYRPQLVGVKHWHTMENERYLVFLYKASDFTGCLQSSDEGEVSWVKKENLADLDLAYDLLNLVRIFDEDNLSELFYSERLGADFIREFW
ncbi:8-oxo-dGTP diphosphatase [Streptococcus sciuri]|uniref:8-oxo-dGTP diphosphatase n=1 Tax=Streptococcus sciuri TaxID=2973939 RepID=A0ABT2F6K4_9STRE|nr:8-oxo-dGTP diphosphatase [Streptococcus sciuri]MCS4488064.1 8-oxo-dGTP diphosphatase [Streptococcus sciuri]